MASVDLEKLKDKLRSHKAGDIIITKHAGLQAIMRQIDFEEVKRNILNPDKLIYAEKQNSKKFNEEKYDCYFAYSSDFVHRYILVINGKVIIVTIIKINRNWQKIVERKWEILNLIMIQKMMIYLFM